VDEITASRQDVEEKGNFEDAGSMPETGHTQGVEENTAVTYANHTPYKSL